MHEVGILNQALEIAYDAASAEGASRITRIFLRIGALAGVVPEAMAFAFEVVTKGGIAEGAAFEWEETPVLCRCSSGCADFQPEGPLFYCPVCGMASSELLQGRELELVDIDIEV